MMRRITPAEGSGGPKQGIQSIEVGSKVLLALADGGSPSALSEVAKRSGMHPSKAHRYLVTLVRVGLASQDVSTGRYDHLGPASRHLGVEALRRTDAVTVAPAYAMELRDTSGQTVNVSVWSDAGPLVVRSDTGSHVVAITIRVGSILPLVDSAIGHVFLAYMPPRTTSGVLKMQQRHRETRTLPPAEIDALIEEVREHGFATATGLIFGLGAIAVPVFGADGTLEIALSLALPRRIFTEATVKRLSPLLRATADRVSQELGLGIVGAD